MIKVPHRALDAQVMRQSIRLLRAMGRVVGKPRNLVNLEVKLTRSLGLFDRKHYLAQIDPAELRDMSPLRHYVVYGDAAGLSPCPMFDVAHFDAHCGERHGLNRLLHYGLVSRFKGQAPTAWFDPQYYLQSNPDVRQAGLDPLEHFQKWGWREGRSPLPGMDIRHLLLHKPQWRVAKDNLLGMLVSGELAKCLPAQASAGRGSERAAPSQAAPWMEAGAWAEVPQRHWDHPPKLDVIIPVYSGAEETLRCLWSVLHAPVRTPHQVVVINDAGPDQNLNAMLRTLAARDLIQLEVNRNNLGFVKTANLGMRRQPQHDVLLLNSDTEVYGDWLDRLMAHAQAHPDLGSLTPLSNNATLCSYPEPQQNNREPLEIPFAELDALAARTNAGVMETAPTGVGFCMFLRRQALDSVGLFDERRFGKGYGEENDLCQRLLAGGWRNGIACDVLVRHVGSVSFGAQAQARTAAGLKTLKRLHPHYEEDVQHHIARDPLWPHRARLDLARLQGERQTKNVLLVCHNRGGGTEKHLVEEVNRLKDQGYGVFEMRPSHEAGCVAVTHATAAQLHNLSKLPLQPEAMLVEVLQKLAITEVHVHHLIDFPTRLSEVLQQVCERLRLVLRIAIHDYYALCPRINLINHQGQYCGQPEASSCNQCLQQDHLQHTHGNIVHWRQRSASFLEAADAVIVPSRDVQQRFKNWLPNLSTRLQPHEVLPPSPLHSFAPARPGETTRVMVIGAISRIKGFDVLRQTAQTAQRLAMPLSFSLLGYSLDDVALRQAGVKVLGRYFDQQLQERIQEEAPHLIFIPSIWPETYCYVLSAALASGRRVAVFDLGAQAERVRAHHPGHLVLPLWLAQTPEELGLKLMPPPALTARMDIAA